MRWAVILTLVAGCSQQGYNKAAAKWAANSGQRVTSLSCSGSGLCVAVTGGHVWALDCGWGSTCRAQGVAFNKGGK